MKLIKKGKLEYYIFENLEKAGVKHCFSTRLGGVSEGVHSSLNLSFREDKPENVIENYRIICEAIGTDNKNTVWTRQIHTDNVIEVTEADRGKGLFAERQAEGYDGIYTNKKNVVLTGFSADCVLLFFYAPDVKAVAMTHSGWRGTVLEIGGKTADILAEKYGADKSQILAGISPAIGKCCFQVDRPVVDKFIAKLPWSKDFITEDKTEDGKFFIDLHGINQRILENHGLKTENIENSRICTKCHPDVFFSHRVMGNARGSLAGLISL
ncbi:MAG: peptidoglycan editing factor PgeF [Firmicutes bacterium]|nr:peptidoglycan editing factor PgeF [Bacillota bacterium]